MRQGVAYPLMRQDNNQIYLSEKNAPRNNKKSSSDVRA
jgi:hypothetical protein